MRLTLLGATALSALSLAGLARAQEVQTCRASSGCNTG